jgi:SAM-dependent methyltransferase
VRGEERGNVRAWLMERVDQSRDSRGHHEQVASLLRAGVAIGVGHAPRSDDHRARGRDDLVRTEPEAELTAEDVPRFVVAFVRVERRDPAVTDLRRPLHNHEVAAASAFGEVRKALDGRHARSMPPLPCGGVRANESARRYGQVFDEVAEEYDAVRSGYPGELLDTAIADGDLGEGSRVVEVGCGTGKLTEGLIARGLRVEAIDPGPSMVAMAQRRVGASDAVRFHVTTFEDADLPESAFDAVFSAAAFHWVDPNVSWRKVASLLRPGGMLALLNHIGVVDGRTAESDAALRDVLGVHAPEILATLHEPRTAEDVREGVRERSANVSDVWSWIVPHDLAAPEAATLFEEARFHSVSLFRRYTADELIALWRTTSLCARLAVPVREALEADDRAVVERFGRTIEASHLAVLVTAHRSA